jgi:alcohol dehydrogenase class IV
MATSIALPRIMRVGGGAVRDIGEVVASLGLSRPLIVTDAFLVNNGAAEQMMKSLESSGLRPRLFGGCIPDPTTDSLQAGLDELRDHDSDVVIGFGGGSPMDTAKALGLLGKQGGHMRDFKAPRNNTGPALPVVAVPTTAGSGSEATQFTIITDAASDEKMLCTGLAFLPIAAVIDYELTMTMPRRLTADTGVDALTHAIEAYVSRKANPFADSMALVAIETIGRVLRRVYHDPDDVDARGEMMLAATQAGIAFSNSSVALVHGMSRPIGAHFHVAHGLSNAMLFPAVTAFSVDAAPGRYGACARALGAATTEDDDEVAAAKLVVELRQLCVDVEVPTPRIYGIDKRCWDDLTPLMAKQALASGSPNNNPRIPTDAEICDLYAEIYG